MDAQLPSLEEQIVAHASKLGFDRAAVVAVKPLEHGQYYEEWIHEGRHGQMHYLDRYHALRVDPAVLEPGTRSAVVVLKNYHQLSDKLPSTAARSSASQSPSLRIARYAQGDDYHLSMRSKLRELAAFIHAETGADIQTRPAVDTAPLLERDLALAAGLGWIGKNTMLIHPQCGSYTFIGELLLSLDLGQSVTRIPDRCGRCTQCLDACPTGAIVSPYILDARRCIAYLTIELRGPIPRHLRPLIGDHLFGCDICQAVCPWNRKAPLSQDPALKPRAHYLDLRPEDILTLTQEEFSATFSKSAIKRAKRSGLLRNAAVVLGNYGHPSSVPLLIERLSDEKDPLVRGHIAWALGQIGGLPAREALEQVRSVLEDSGDDPYLIEEIRFAQACIDRA